MHDGIEFAPRASGASNAAIVRAAALLAAIGGAMPTARSQSCAPRWTAGIEAEIPGVSDSTSTSIEWVDGMGAVLIAGGAFDYAGAVRANKIAKWDGDRWHALGAGFSATCSALAIFDDGTGPALYAGGLFTHSGDTPINYVARWNGQSWVGLGGGMDDEVHALTVHDDSTGPALYAAGRFTLAGESPADKVARWDGSIWSAVATAIDGSLISDLASFDAGDGPALFIAGDFTSVDGMAAGGIARWDGSVWSNLNGGVNVDSIRWVHDLHMHDDGSGPALFAGGRFQSIGGVAANGIAKWSGGQWHALGAGLSALSVVESMATFDHLPAGGLIVGGALSGTQGTTLRNIGRWDGQFWSPVGAGRSVAVQTLCSTSVMGPYTLFAGGGPVETAALWDGVEWNDTLGGGTDNTIYSIAAGEEPDAASIYLGGEFSRIANEPIPFLARRESGGWAPVGGGVNQAVYSLYRSAALGQASLFAGGDFTQAGGLSANRIARWDGTAWHALGSGASDRVNCMLVFDDGRGVALFVGGEFMEAGGRVCRHIGRWDGTSWSLLGAGLRAEYDKSYAETMAVFDDGTGPALYVGGRFSDAGFVQSNGIARWRNQEWSSLSGGIDANGRVRALASFDDGTGAKLFVGGSFISAGGTYSANFATWTGSNWVVPDARPDNAVYTLFVHDDGSGPALCASGVWRRIGSRTFPPFARLTASGWENVSGPDGTVYDMTTVDDGAGPALFTVGEFSTCDANLNNRLARWGRPYPIAGDLNEDCGVGLEDLALLLSAFSICSGDAGFVAGYDLDASGCIDLQDLTILLSGFGAGT